MTEKKETSFQKWYRLNSEAHNRERREKYNDPQQIQYTEKVRAVNRNARAEERKKLKQDPTRRKHHGEFRSVYIDGIVYFTIGALSMASGCSRQLIRRWERQQLIDPPALEPHQNTHRQRFYTAAQISTFMRKNAARIAKHREKTAGTVPVRGLVRWLDGTTTEEALLRMQFLAETCDRSVTTLLRYEVDGIIPKTPLLREADVQLRLYTVPQVEATARILAEWDEANAPRKLPPTPEVKARIIASWVELGIFSQAPATETAALVMEPEGETNG